MVFDYGDINNWIELYMTQRVGAIASGTATPRLFQRSCFNGTISNWVEFTHS
jgi:hypothetical protein